MGYGIGYRDGQEAACTVNTYAYGSYGTTDSYSSNTQNVYQKMFMYGMGYGVGYRDGQAAGCNRFTSYDPYRPTPYPS